MNIKSLLLGSAAALIAAPSAMAADIIIPEPEMVEYVRVCDAAGTGYWYIPGTEVCLKFSGYVRMQIDASDLDVDIDPAGVAAVQEGFSFNSILPATIEDGLQSPPAPAGSSVTLTKAAGVGQAALIYFNYYDAFDTSGLNFTVPDDAGPVDNPSALAILQALTPAAQAYYTVGAGASALTPAGNDQVPANQGDVFGLLGEEYNVNNPGGLAQEFTGLQADAYYAQLEAALKQTLVLDPTFLLPIVPTAIDLLSDDVIANLKANLGNAGYQQLLWTLGDIGVFDGLVGFDNDAAWANATGAAVGTAAGLLGFQATTTNDGWDTTTSARLVVETWNDSELGALTTRMQLGGTAGGDLGLQEATIGLGGLQLGYDDTLWDGGINGEFDQSGGADINHIRYTFDAGASSFGLSIENEDNNVDYMPNIVGKAMVELGGITLTGFAYYDDYDAGGSNDALVQNSVLRAGPAGTWVNGQDDDAWGAKLIASAGFGAATFQAMGIYNSGKSFYDNDYEWSAAASVAFDATEATTVTVGGQYLNGFLVGSQTWGDATGFNDDGWKAGITVDHELVPGFDIKADLQYQSYDYGIAKVDGWAGFLRFEGSF